MDTEPHIGNILNPKELVLKIHRDTDPRDFKTREQILRDHYHSLEGKFDKEILELYLNGFLGFIFWEAGEYQQAIDALKHANLFLHKADSDLHYFTNNSILVKCYSELSKYNQAIQYAIKGMQKVEEISKVDEKNGGRLLATLKDYLEVIQKSGDVFDDQYFPLIKKAHQWWGFDQQKENWEETLTMMINENRKWNRKISLIILDQGDGKDVSGDLEKYIKECPVAWYRNYAREILTK